MIALTICQPHVMSPSFATGSQSTPSWTTIKPMTKTKYDRALAHGINSMIHLLLYNVITRCILTNTFKKLHLFSLICMFFMIPFQNICLWTLKELSKFLQIPFLYKFIYSNNPMFSPNSLTTYFHNLSLWIHSDRNIDKYFLVADIFLHLDKG